MSSRASLNHIYRTVWNESLGAMVAVAEIATCHSGSSGASSRSKGFLQLPDGPVVYLGALALGIAIGWGGLPGLALANPTGAVAIVGQASLVNQGNKLTVTTQNGAGSSYSAINWQSFSIPTGSATYFQQPTSASTSINRVVTNTPSLLFGTLGSNGNLVLVNQSGIAVGAGAVVDTAGFTASALSMSDADALSGRMRFGDGSAATAGVSVQGSILARSGDVVLLGTNVDTGQAALIQAPNGSTILAAGQQIELTGRGLEGITLQVQAPTDSAVNLGTLQGGAVGIFAGTLKHSGAIQATGVSIEGGKVVLNATDTVAVDGQVSARLASGAGGTVNITGREIDLQAGSLIAADAAGTSDGGAIKVLADDTAHIAGTISARGGEAGGNGGFVETSGTHVKIEDSARVNTAAALGLSGTWLIDPTDFTIAATGGDIDGATLSINLASNVVIESSAGTHSGSTGVGDVNVNDAVSWSNPTTLTLNAYHSVNISALIDARTNAGAGSFVARADSTGIGSGTVVFNASNLLKLGSGRADLYYNPVSYTDVATKSDIAGNPYSGNIMLGGAYTAWMLVNDQTNLQAVNTNLGGYYALGANVTLSGDFTPLGALGTPFAGSFYGLGHTVTGLNINLTTTDYVGLFGYTGPSAVIRNLGLTGGSVVGQNNAGALVGQNHGTISNSYASGTVSGSGYVGGLVGSNYGTVSNSYASGTVSGSSYVGGLVGDNRSGSSIVNSYASGTVRGSSYVGGLVGYNQGTINNSYVANGSYIGGNANVGGLVGSNYGTVSNSHYNIDAVTINDSSVQVTLGGLYDSTSDTQFSTWLSDRQPLGLPLDITANTSFGTCGIGCYTISNVNGMKDLLGFSDLAGNTFQLENDITLSGNLHIPTFASSFDGRSYTLINLNINQPYASNIGLFGRLESSGSVSNLNVTVGTVRGYNDVGGLVGSNSGGSISNSHVSFSGSGSGVIGGGNYGDTGGLVGYNNGGTISNSSAVVSVSGTGYVGGLVGDNSGSISNSYAGGTVSGNSSVGGLVGYNDGTITGIITGSSSSTYATGSVTGGGSGTSYIGGLVGYNAGTISNSFATGSVAGGSPGNNVGGLVGYNFGLIEGSWATGDVSGADYVGGLVGKADYSEGGSTITNSYASGNVTGSNYVGGLVGYNSGSISNSYATGAVTGTTNVGGLVGFNYSGNISNSYAYGNVTGVTNVGGLVGQNGDCPDGCYAYGSIDGSGAYGTVTGVTNVGGLVGLNSYGSSISNSYANYDVTAGYFNSDNTFIPGGSEIGGLVGLNRGAISNSYAYGSVTGDSNVGGLVGKNDYGTISASHAFGNVNGGTNVGGLVGYLYGGSIGDSHAIGDVSGTDYVGGLVGYNYGGSISNSYAIGAVNGASYVGGLVGSNRQNDGGFGGSIINSYATGIVEGTGNDIGGLVGFSFGSIGNSYATGAVTGVGSLSSNVGGLVGYNDGGTLIGNFFNQDVNKNGGLSGVGYDTASDGSTDVNAGPLTNLQMTQIASFGDWNIANTGGSTATWRIYEGHTAPLLRSFLSLLPLTDVSVTYDGSAQVGTTASGVSGSPATGTNAGLYSTGYWSTQSQGYDITGGSLTIEPASVTITPITPTVYSISMSGSRVYDGTNIVNASIFSLSGLVGNQTLTLTGSGTVADKNVGVNKPVSLGSLTLGNGTGSASNYTFSGGTQVATITAAPITGVSGITAANKVYDGTTAASVNAAAASLTGVISGDSVSLSAANAVSGAFSDKNAGLGKTVTITGLALSGADAGNYNLSSSTATTTADISKAALTGVSGITASNKVYDGTTAASLSVAAASLTGVISGDSVNVAGATGAFGDKNVGTGKTVSISGIALAGTDALNYTLGSTTTSTTADISKAAIAAVTGITAANKVYDGNTAATLNTAAASFTGEISGDSLSVATGATGTFSNKNAGTGKTVSINGIALSGADALNYTLGSSTASTTADISKAAIAAVTGITAATKVYDGTTVATLNTTVAAFPGEISGDSLSLAAGATGAFSDRNVGLGKTVSITGLALSGTDAGNYSLGSSTASTTGTITVRPLSTWTATGSGQWSTAGNWDALPDGSNVLAVSIPAGVAVTYDAAVVPTSLQTLNSAGTLALAGGSLSVAGNLSTTQYSQTGGALTGGQFKVNTSFSQSGGSVVMNDINIVQASGPLSFSALNASTVSLTAQNGAIVQTGPIVTADLTTSSTAGTILDNAGNRISNNWQFNNAGSGNIKLVNVGVLNLLNASNDSGNIEIVDTGGLTTRNLVIAPNGSVSITTNSPLTVGVGGISASGDILLNATNLTSAGNMTLDGPLDSSAGGITLTAANNFVQNSTLTAALGINVSAGGTMTFGPFAMSTGHPVNYFIGGVPLAPPWVVSAISAATGDFVTDFSNQFQNTLIVQTFDSDDPLALYKRNKDGDVVEGQLCSR